MMLNNEYKKLVNTILENGTIVIGRNGKTLAIPHYSLTIEDMANDYKITLRKIHTKGIEGEFKTLMSAEPLVNVAQFKENNCNYWGDWAGPKGELNLDYYNQLHPTIENVISQINKDPGSRRHVVSLWNNENAFDGSLSLHSCWHNLTFSIIDKVIHLTWTQRSVDTMIGLPSDIVLAHLFMAHVSLHTNLAIGSCMFALSNVHIYEEHLDGALEILHRTGFDHDKPLKFQLKA